MEFLVSIITSALNQTFNVYKEKNDLFMILIDHMVCLRLKSIQ